LASVLAGLGFDTACVLASSREALGSEPPVEAVFQNMSAIVPKAKAHAISNAFGLW
jgi:hypothetical protein